MNELTTEQKANLKHLSDAMRAGAAIRPKATGVLFNRRAGSELVSSCALGAAWEGAHPAFDADHWINAANNDEDFIGLSEVEHYFGLTNNALAIDPTSKLEHTVSGIIINLNDRVRWTREAIADWLLTLV